MNGSNVISIPENEKFIDIEGNSWYIRPCYNEILQKMEEKIAFKDSKPYIKQICFLVYGSPGLGKSIFCSYLATRLKQKYDVDCIESEDIGVSSFARNGKEKSVLIIDNIKITEDEYTNYDIVINVCNYVQKLYKVYKTKRNPIIFYLLPLNSRTDNLDYFKSCCIMTDEEKEKFNENVEKYNGYIPFLKKGVEVGKNEIKFYTHMPSEYDANLYIYNVNKVDDNPYNVRFICKECEDIARKYFSIENEEQFYTFYRLYKQENQGLYYEKIIIYIFTRIINKEILSISSMPATEDRRGRGRPRTNQAGQNQSIKVPLYFTNAMIEDRVKCIKDSKFHVNSFLSYQICSNFPVIDASILNHKSISGIQITVSDAHEVKDTVMILLLMYFVEMKEEIIQQLEHSSEDEIRESLQNLGYIKNDELKEIAKEEVKNDKFKVLLTYHFVNSIILKKDNVIQREIDKNCQNLKNISINRINNYNNLPNNEKNILKNEADYIYSLYDKQILLCNNSILYALVKSKFSFENYYSNRDMKYLMECVNAFKNDIQFIPKVNIVFISINDYVRPDLSNGDASFQPYGEYLKASMTNFMINNKYGYNWNDTNSRSQIISNLDRLSFYTLKLDERSIDNFYLTIKSNCVDEAIILENSSGITTDITSNSLPPSNSIIPINLPTCGSNEPFKRKLNNGYICQKCGVLDDRRDLFYECDCRNGYYIYEGNKIFTYRKEETIINKHEDYLKSIFFGKNPILTPDNKYIIILNGAKLSNYLRNIIYVRSVYIQVWEFLNKILDDMVSYSSDNRITMLLRGHPGCGKTSFLIFVILKIMEYQNEINNNFTVIIMKGNHKGDPSKYLINNGTFENYDNMKIKPLALIIVDTYNINPGNTNIFCISSPDEKNYGNIIENRKPIQELYFDVFSNEEIEEWKYCLPLELRNKAIEYKSLLGNVPRQLLFASIYNVLYGEDYWAKIYSKCIESIAADMEYADFLETYCYASNVIDDKEGITITKPQDTSLSHFIFKYKVNGLETIERNYSEYVSEEIKKYTQACNQRINTYEEALKIKKFCITNFKTASRTNVLDSIIKELIDYEVDYFLDDIKKYLRIDPNVGLTKTEITLIGICDEYKRDKNTIYIQINDNRVNEFCLDMLFRRID